MHCFHVIDRAESSFAEIARLTGGRSEKLDVNSSTGADMLTEFFSCSILKDAGGDRGSELVAAYHNMFGKGYTATWQ